jgi:spoIIIJ-associated protein
MPSRDEYHGPTVEAAVARGLEVLRAARDEVEIEILDRGARGFLGLGRREARVRLSRAGGPVERLADLARGVLSRMGIEATVRARLEGRTAVLEVDAGPASKHLIGRRGETLQALQHVLLRMAGQRVEGGPAQIRVDVAGYRERQDHRLEAMARDLADRARRTGKRTLSEPLPAADRQVIHRILSGDPGLEAHAMGEGASRRIVVIPRRRKTGR